jgi:hypothetical protein
MATTKIDIRMDNELLVAIARRGGNRTQFIAAACWEMLKKEGTDGHLRVDADNERAAVKRSRNRATLPVLQATEGKAVFVHPLQPVRDELGRQRQHLSSPTPPISTPTVAHTDHQTYNAGDKRWCSDCHVYY